jgi:hypothetical protein
VIPPRRAGVLFRAASGDLAFLPASVVLRVAALPPISPLVGAPPGVLGVVHESGDIIAVIELGPARGFLMVCAYRGDSFGLLGASDLRAGLFDVDPSDFDCVRHEGERAERFDLAAIYERLGAASWASLSAT